ncbi:GcrA family cell cycle regulator [Henriciella sp. AS95]|uniref:GcrA family cell cycle regulator n=1 Tax=Henriciella sp. AS95 TaxID=3135782 RepID=UPI00316F886D
MNKREEIKIRDLWAHGFSAADIATQLDGWSRNQVIAAVHRLGLSGRVTKSVRITSGSGKVMYVRMLANQLEAEEIRSRKRAQNPKIISPPGYRLAKLLKVLFPKRFFQSVLEQTIQDMQEEYNEALAEGNLKSAQWIRVRGYVSVCSAIFTGIPARLFRTISAFSKSD